MTPCSDPRRSFFAAGRVGNTEDLGLADIGVETDERGRIRVDDHFQTTAPGIYAAGDVIGPPALASASMEQGRVAACYALGIPFKKTVDPLTPFGVYSIPECAMVGLTEEQAAAAGPPLRDRQVPIRRQQPSRHRRNHRGDGEAGRRRRRPAVAGRPHRRGGGHRTGAPGPGGSALRGDGRLLHPRHLRRARR